jgi:alkylated DNA repair dioxygenase AlkB
VWQPSLLGDGPSTPELAFSSLRRIQLDERSWVDYAPGWLAGEDALFEELFRTGRWRQRQVRMYDRTLPEPRLTAGWGRRVGALPDPSRDDSADPGADLSVLPAALRDLVDPLSARYGVTFDSVWVNLYRDGRDSVAWHGDRNAKVQTNPLVVTVSLGARRRFLLRRKGTSSTAVALEPGHGDLVVMGGACQHEWEHTVPKTTRPVGPRMSVTIRHSADA